MKDFTEKELKNKAEAYCSAMERCPSDVEKKLIGWGASPEITAEIMAHLFKERYLDTIRFCCAYVRDKYRFNQWGRIKISQALRIKGLTADEIQTGMDEIDDDEYNEILQSLLKQKLKSIKAASDYDRNAKLIRFAAGRGFTMQEIMKYVKSDF